jgi:uncharacterized protein (TIGR03435 family)
MKLTIAFLLCAGCFAQSAPPSFETASIHPNPRVERQEAQVSPGALVMRNQPLFFLVQWACFDIVAKASGPADEKQLRLMLQTLLANRFGLRLHKETRVVPVYAITLAKGGPKFQESATEGAFVIERTNPVILNAHHARMSDLAQGISAEVKRPVVDNTGLTGRYEIHMDLSAYLNGTGGAGDGQLDLMSILFSGFQDLLGLKLEARKQSVDVLVIDHAEKTPTEN